MTPTVGPGYVRPEPQGEHVTGPLNRAAAQSGSTGNALERLLERELDRRQFLLLTGGAGFAVYLGGPRSALAIADPPPPADPVVTFDADIRRARDFLSIHVDGYNLELDTSGTRPTRSLKRKVQFKNSYLAIRFVPQGSRSRRSSSLHRSTRTFPAATTIRRRTIRTTRRASRRC